MACGNCTKVCSQGAKVFVNTVDMVTKVLEKPGKIGGPGGTQLSGRVS
ncbi:MAG: hypothetical protein MZV63_28155 [Marinilabiliales bacterium]|nr:hypothetical protein [Marinilabiliales bacterium]